MDNLNPNNLTAAEELKKAEEMQGKSVDSYEDSHFNPEKNPNSISILKQSDGNWKLFSQKNGKMIEVRGIKPEDCLAEFITHE